MACSLTKGFNSVVQIGSSRDHRGQRHPSASLPGGAAKASAACPEARNNRDGLPNSS